MRWLVRLFRRPRPGPFEGASIPVNPWSVGARRVVIRIKARKGR